MATTHTPTLVEAPMDKLLRLKQLQQRLADLNRRIAIEAPPQPRPWHDEARPEQLPPRDGDWSIYLACCGRGWDKTRAGAEWIAEQAATEPGTEWAVITPTVREVRKTCIEGAPGCSTRFCPANSTAITPPPPNSG